jgi:hypothetical protein
MSRLIFNKLRAIPATAMEIRSTSLRVMGVVLWKCLRSTKMLTKIAAGGKIQGDWIARLTQPPILWIRFLGWLGSGVGLGWLIRDWTNDARVGAISWAIKLVVISAIVSQVPVVIYVLLQCRSGKHN